MIQLPTCVCVCDFPSAGINEIAKTRHCTNHLHVTYIPVYIIQATSNGMYHSFISSRNWNNTAKIWNNTKKQHKNFQYHKIFWRSILYMVSRFYVPWQSPNKHAIGFWSGFSRCEISSVYLWCRWQWTKIERRNSMRKIWLKPKNNLNHEISKAVQLTLYTHVFCHYWWNISR